MLKVITICCSLLLLSCTKKSYEGRGNLKVLNQYSGEITHLDPQVASGLASSLQMSKSYESLYEVHPYNSPYELLPSLASAMPKVSRDGKTYRITLKDNVLYHECECLKKNRSVSAKDFVTSFKRMADPKLMSPHFSYWSKYIVGLQRWYELNKAKEQTDYQIELEGVVALDDRTIEFKLKDKFPDFIYLLTSPSTAPIPLEALEYYNNDLSTSMVGTGPFKLVNYTPNSSLSFRKNPKYRLKYFPKTANEKYQKYLASYAGKRVPFLDGIEVKIIKESQTAWLNFLSGKIDYLEVAKDNFSEVFTPNLKLSTKMKNKGIVAGAGQAKSNLYYFGLNQLSSNIKDKRVRQAMAYAFDFEKFNKLFFNSTAVIASSLLPPGIQGNKPALQSPYRQVNRDLAKKLLKEANYSPRPLTMLVRNKTTSRQTAEFFKSEMEKIGIEVIVKTSSWSQLMSELQKGKFDIFYLSWFVALPKGPEFFELLYGGNHPGSYNRVGFHHDEFDKLFIKAKKESNLNKQDLLVRKMNSIAMEYMPIIPLVHTKNFFVRQSWLRNYVPTDQIGGLEQYYDIVH